MTTTKILVPIQEHDEVGSKNVYVVESYDEVIEKIQPLAPPTSALEHRTQFQYTLPDGRRVWIPPMSIAYVEENVSNDE